jgi:hypothetical protein
MDEIPPSTITLATNAEYLRSIVPNDGRLRFWINQKETTGNPAASNTEINEIRRLMTHLDSITGITLSEASSHGSAQIIFTKREELDQGAAGRITYHKTHPYINILWKDNPGASNITNFVLRHEIGHLAALKHIPAHASNGIESAMSNDPREARDWGFTEFDQKAMRSLWGEDEIRLTGTKQNLKSTVFADKFILTKSNGFKKKNADTITGFNGKNGDHLFFTHHALEWSESDAEYNFYTINNRRNQKKLLTAAERQLHPYALIYDRFSGKLFSDLNGSAYGLGGGGVVAIFQGNTWLKEEHISQLE